MNPIEQDSAVKQPCSITKHLDLNMDNKRNMCVCVCVFVCECMSVFFFLFLRKRTTHIIGPSCSHPQEFINQRLGVFLTEAKIYFDN